MATRRDEGPGQHRRRAVKVAISLAGRLTNDPRLLPEAGRKALARLIDRRHRKQVGNYAEQSVPMETGLAGLLGLETVAVRTSLDSQTLRDLLEELAEYPIPASGAEMGGPAFLELCYSVARLIQPRVVVETGVAHGFSTAVILQGLEDNGQGRLFSVDLPAFRPGVTRLTAGAVPARLRSPRWQLTLGPQRSVLPELLQRVGPIDLFLHDSDKSYRGMLACSRLAWPHLRPGGMLIVDDIESNDAFMDFAREQRLTPLIVAKPTESGVYRSRVFWVGLLRKPASHGLTRR